MMKRRIVWLAALLVAAGLSRVQAAPADDYEAARALLSEKRYNEAAAAFDDLGSYADAPFYAVYSSAAAAGEAGYYSVAAENLSTLTGFLDADMLAAYYRALAQEASENYEGAAKTLQPISLYRDAAERYASYPERIRQRDYRKAERLESKGRLSEARDAFLALGAYEDSEARAARLNDAMSSQDYEKAEGLLAEGNSADAFDRWTALGEYRDSAERAGSIREQALYQKALRAAEKGAYEEAYAGFAALGDYGDSAEKAHVFGVAAFADPGSMEARGPAVFAYAYKGRYGLANWQRNTLSAPAWQSIGLQMENGLLVVRDAEGGTGCVNADGVAVIPPAYSAITIVPAGGGVMIAEDRQGGFTLLTSAGEELCRQRWASIRPTGQPGLLAVCRGELWGLINTRGETVTEPAYTEIRDYHDGRSAACRNGKWGYLDTEGREHIEAVYEKADDFVSGQAGVYTAASGWTVIDRDGVCAYFAGEGYAEGMRYMEKGDYAAAAACFVRAKDALMAGRAYSLAANRLMDAGDYAGAAEAFEAAGAYADAPQRAKEAWNAEGQRLLASGDAAAAALAFDRAGRGELASNIRTYAEAERALAAGDTVRAYDRWQTLGGYEDSAQRAEAVREPAIYEKALTAAEGGRFKEAYAYFASLGEYRDSARKAYLFSVSTFAQDTNSLGSECFAYRLNGVWGLVNWAENVMRPARWDSIAECQSNGLMIVQDGSQYGCIDRRGRTSIEPRFTDLSSFAAYGLAKAKTGDGWGYIDKDRTEVVPCRYDVLEGFGSNGLALARARTGGAGYVRYTGEETIPSEYAAVSAFKDGLCVAASNEGAERRYSLFREDGQRLSEGWKTLGEANAASASVIAAPVFPYGSICAEDAQGKWTLLSPEGEERCEARWDAFEGYGESDRIAARRGNLWGFIDGQGNVIAEPRYTEVRLYAENVAAVKRAGHWGYLDRDGREAVMPVYDEVQDFAGGAGQAFSAGTGWHIFYMDDKRLHTNDEICEAGMNLLRDGAFTEAEALFTEADYGMLAKAARYYHAEAMLSAKQPRDARPVFESLGEYGDAAERVPETHYVEAEQLLAAADYDGAAAAFGLAGTYSDAAERVLETWYAKGEALLAAADYNGAAAAFGKAGTYNDAATRVLESWYAKGEALLAAADYDGAAAAFGLAGTYSDAATRILESWYAKGEALLALEDYEGAKAAFVKAGNHSDAPVRMQKMWYAKGEAMLEASEYDAAAEYFGKAGTYSDAATRILETWYAKGEALLAAEDYDRAKEAFALAGDYSDAAVCVQKTLYAKGKALFAAGKYKDAAAAFDGAGNYQDAAQQAKESRYLYAGQLVETENYREAYLVYRQIRGFGDVDSILAKNRKIRAAFIAPYKTPGTIVTYGHYEQDDDETNGPEPIEWIVAGARENRALLISRYALEMRAYNDKFTEITWEFSAIRDWLNLDFIEAAFSPEEQKGVLSRYVDNSEVQGYTRWRTKGGRGTHDRVFLLSYIQTRRYLKDEQALACEPTAYALAHKAEITPIGEPTTTGGWWLRSPGEYQDYAAYIAEDGTLKHDFVTNPSYGIRPAFWIDLSIDPM